LKPGHEVKCLIVVTDKHGRFAMKYSMIALSLLLLGGSFANDAGAAGRHAGRSFEECQALAVSRGVAIRRTGKVAHRYLRLKASGLARNPQGLMARCMAGTD
jgi:hypothetical protein